MSEQTTKPKPARNKSQGMNWIRIEKRLAIYHRDGFACVVCGAKALGFGDADISEDNVQLTLDHIEPSALGGTNATRNLVTMCMRCNRMKGDLKLRAWLKKLRACGVNTKALRLRIARRIDKSLDMERGRMLAEMRCSK